MPEWLDLPAGPWVLAAALVSIHSWFLTRPVIKQWRDCEAEKRLLREEHREMRAEMVKMWEKLTHLENGGQDG